MKKIDREKQEIREDLTSYLYLEVGYLLSGSLEECSQKILDIPKRLEEQGRKIDQFTHFTIDCWQHYESVDINIFGIRLETDEERDSRVALADKRSKAAKLAAIKSAETKKAKEIALLKELKEKYPDQ